MDILDSVEATPSSPFISSTATSLELPNSPIPPIEPESLGSSPRQSSTHSSSARPTTLSSSTAHFPLGQILTRNTSFYDIPITDAFTELLERYIPPDQRPERQQQQQPLIHLDDKPEGLMTMVMNNHWRAVARYARQKLVETSPQDADTILQLWYVRLLALYQLQLYQLASAEFEKLTDLLQQPKDDKVPFDMRVLWAILPFKLQHPLITLERLSTLAIQCQHQQSPQREYQVYLILATKLIQMQDYHAAANTLKAVLRKVMSMDPLSSSRLDLFSSLGRLYLQLGDLITAEQMYKELERIEQPSSLLQETIKTNKAFLHMAKGEWTLAEQILDQVVQQNNENLTAMNNLAVCLVYTGKLSKAMALLDGMIKQHPVSAGTSPITLMNLCTLYELRFDGAGLIGKKVQLTKDISRWVGDSFQPQCVKLP
ncbi:uncharacterized protein BX664DRAFT_330357 [Halteromyces radiatus]|uniref:uncharacterized protein n=1 Tax=Halteromyces radiatus TaxID=101107 RepID=UPI00221E7952|nr:uncharacterized protein BX664DRAFT_330357 [Halteromyces radiatus]KAI8093705.1 hypothetical protein BX664DRAFT_330357 [Halteromyces radiatus]